MMLYDPFLHCLLEWFLSHCCIFLFVPFLCRVLLFHLLAIFLVWLLLCRQCSLFLGRSFLFPCLPLWRFRLVFCLVQGFCYFLVFLLCIPFLFLLLFFRCFLFCILVWVSSWSLLYVLLIPRIPVLLVWPDIGLRSSLLCVLLFPVDLLFLVHLLLLYCILFHCWFSLFSLLAISCLGLFLFCWLTFLFSHWFSSFPLPLLRPCSVFGFWCICLGLSFFVLRSHFCMLLWNLLLLSSFASSCIL